jgi:SAM-dependent methyltransferase
MSTEKQRTFNEVAELYDRMRPSYPAQLIEDLVELARLPASGRILEVGAGTGISTLPLAERGYEIVAVELGSDMAAVARRKVAAFDNVDVVVADFEDWQLPNGLFDLVVSGTAWHWIDPAIGFTKAATALRRDGALAIFGYSHIAGGDQAFFEQAQDCYLRFMPGTDPNERLEERDTYRPNISKLEASRLFETPKIRTYVTEETYSRAQYLDLLATYSDHRALPAASRESLYACIGALIDENFGGEIRKRYINELIVRDLAPRTNP